MPEGATDDELATAWRRSTPRPRRRRSRRPNPSGRCAALKATTLSAPLGTQAALLQVAVADVLPSTHVAVRRHPKNFEPAE